ncbi:MAG TPA: AAC(3) family N-acetyltransferase [Armatimonadota bacterium]|nr:AAC(3) family N-acetyltransferase [Armatimonadota bacterium]
MSLTHDDLTEGFQRAGVCPGMKLMVHSSLRKFGHVDGGARTVIEALQEVVTEDGTLLLPSFNHGTPFQGGGAGIYDPRETPTPNGIIPETFRKMPGVWRGMNPTHPYCAWGRDAERFVNRHHLTLTMGPDSPQGMLQREGGYCLFLGTNYHTNTFKHVVEMSTGAPCLGRRTFAVPVRAPDGRVISMRSWGYRASACPISDPHEHIDVMMDVADLHKHSRIGGAITTLFKLEDCFNVLADMLRTGHAGFPPCTDCPVRPAASAHDVETDWDDESDALLPDAEARDLEPMAWLGGDGEDR